MRCMEILDYSTYDNRKVLFDIMGFGLPADEKPLLLQPGVLPLAWGSVVRGLAGKVGVLLRPPLIDTYNKQVIEISSCDDLALKPDTQGLGKFVFTRFGDGWIISGHEPEPNPCPTPTDPPPPPAGAPGAWCAAR
ncbi:hypothetical protein ACFQ1S_10805 [Kibdelosporangium lantanae]|uniref:Uncharacterized protein n=1 Tax=Kibdelosporangium lantanae TaxID=1497396 RepID=A0ABW3M6S3_9PSEU